jgi:hypothetical protein
MLGPISTVLLFTILLILGVFIPSNKPVYKTGITDLSSSSDVRQVTVRKAHFPGPGNAPGEYLNENVTIPEIAFKFKGNKEVVMGGNIEVEIKADGSA